MDKFPVNWEGRQVGELTVERESLYTWFAIRSRLPGPGLWCAWAEGDCGRLRIGVLEPVGERAVIRRRFSDRMTASLGRLVRGELKPVLEDTETWKPVERAETLFQTQWLSRQMLGVSGVLMRTEEERRFVAVPYSREAPFPLTPWFCFASVQKLQNGFYAVYGFDEKERPFWIGTQKNEKT